MSIFYTSTEVHLLMTILNLYHGSTKVIPRPTYGQGKTTNDYGLGFYLTEDEELASEWACSKYTEGIINRYTIDTSCLNILNLNSDGHSILNWVDILIQNRGVRGSTPVMRKGIEYLHANFSLDIDGYDAIVGYRADDSYFSFTRAFLTNQISIQQLSMVMRLGNLGEQFVLKSQLAFDILEYQGSDIVDSDIYSIKYSERDNKARDDYRKELEKNDLEGLFMQDIIRGGLSYDDIRI